ncbi:MAG TPA: hypothetical protein VGJ55_10365 [Pyrinomonadaceae bacterium]
MPYFDQPITQGIPYLINVDNSTGGKTAITILKINRRDRFAAAELRFVDPGVRTQLTETVERGIDRVIIAVHPPAFNQLGVEIKQDAVSFPQSCNGDTEIVFDTVP